MSSYQIEARKDTSNHGPSHPLEGSRAVAISVRRKKCIGQMPFHFNLELNKLRI